MSTYMVIPAREERLEPGARRGRPGAEAVWFRSENAPKPPANGDVDRETPERTPSSSPLNGPQKGQGPTPLSHVRGDGQGSFKRKPRVCVKNLLLSSFGDWKNLPKAESHGTQPATHRNLFGPGVMAWTNLATNQLGVSFFRGPPKWWVSLWFTFKTPPTKGTLSKTTDRWVVLTNSFPPPKRGTLKTNRPKRF